ncbi:unnamed protein product [Gordionus sp. m RMFG-2023]
MYQKNHQHHATHPITPCSNIEKERLIFPPTTKDPPLSFEKPLSYKPVISIPVQIRSITPPCELPVIDFKYSLIPIAKYTSQDAKTTPFLNSPISSKTDHIQYKGANTKYKALRKREVLTNEVEDHQRNRSQSETETFMGRVWA